MTAARRDGWLVLVLVHDADEEAAAKAIRTVFGRYVGLLVAPGCGYALVCAAPRLDAARRLERYVERILPSTVPGSAVVRLRSELARETRVRIVAGGRVRIASGPYAALVAVVLAELSDELVRVRVELRTGRREIDLPRSALAPASGRRAPYRRPAPRARAVAPIAGTTTSASPAESADAFTSQPGALAPQRERD